MKSESSPTYKCRYCNKEFRKESTLTAHVCEQKRRAQQEKDMGVQWGLRAYLRFYELTQGSTKKKSYEDFCASPYYNAFVKFGKYCQSIHCINFVQFSEWLLKNNKKLDFWCKDSLYTEWLLQYLKKESVQDALERAMYTMQDYAESHPDLKNGYRDYFRYGNSNRICLHVTTGRISPWVIYNCDSGVEFIDRLDQTQLALIMPYIDPVYWARYFNEYLADTEWAKEILTQAGL